LKDTSLTLFVKKYFCGKDRIFSKFTFLNNLLQYEITGETETISKKEGSNFIISIFFS